MTGVYKLVERRYTCGLCKGTGEWKKRPCPSCRGLGYKVYYVQERK